MSSSPDLWTFPVPGTDSLVVTPPDREGFLFLNPTAAFIFQNPDPTAYAHHFGISLAQAKSDIEATEVDPCVDTTKGGRFIVR